MSDDSFVREVNEELRQDQMKALWERFGTIAVAAGALVILATAAYVAYDYWSTSRANQAGDTYAQAMELVEEGNPEEALTALQALEENGHGSYPALAQLSAAGLLADQGRAQEAVAKLDAVAEDGSVPDAIRDMARLRAGLLLVDHGSYSDVAAHVEPLTSDGNHMRHLAREALALAAWKAGERKNALTLFGQILDDPEAPAGARERAEMMSDLIAGSTAESG